MYFIVGISNPHRRYGFVFYSVYKYNSETLFWFLGSTKTSPAFSLCGITQQILQNKEELEKRGVFVLKQKTREVGDKRGQALMLIMRFTEAPIREYPQLFDRSRLPRGFGSANAVTEPTKNLQCLPHFTSGRTRTPIRFQLFRSHIIVQLYN